MSSSTQITPLRLAVCLFQDMSTLDYQGPMELLGSLSPDVVNRGLFESSPPSQHVEVTYLSRNLDPVKPLVGPLVLPNVSYSDIEATNQYEIILVPGGVHITHLCQMRPVD